MFGGAESSETLLMLLTDEGILTCELVVTDESSRDAVNVDVTRFFKDASVSDDFRTAFRFNTGND